MNNLFRKIILNPVFIGSAILMTGSTIANWLNYLYHLILGRLLGPESYGELASLISLSGLLAIIPSSISVAIVKYISSAKSQGEKNDLLSWFRKKTYQFSIIFFVILVFLAPLISFFLKFDNISYVILVAFIFLFTIPTIINRSILQGLLKFKEISISFILENSTKLLVSILLVYFGYQVFGGLIAIAGATLVAWYFTTFSLKPHLKLSNKNSFNVRSIVLYTIPVIIQSFSLTSLYSTDLILVKHFFSSHQAGIYASLSTLGKIIFFASAPIGSVMFPLISQRNSIGGNYKKIFLYSLIATLTITFFILMVYGLVPGFAIYLLFGSSYVEASSLLIWFGFFISIFTICSLIINFNLSLGRTGVAIFPTIAAISQIILIWFIHDTIYIVVLISIIVTTLLLFILFIYSCYGKWLPKKKHKKLTIRNQANFSNSSGL